MAVYAGKYNSFIKPVHLAAEFFGRRLAYVIEDLLFSNIS
jgi:hypothetical protein